MEVKMASEIVNTTHGIMAVANFVRSGGKHPKSLQRMGVEVDWYEVYLPSYVDQDVAHYAEYLLRHPSQYVACRFSQRDLE